jgi:hypothetical protein
MLVAVLVAAPARAQDAPADTTPPPESTPSDPPASDPGPAPTVTDPGPTTSAPAEPPAETPANPPAEDASSLTAAGGSGNDSQADYQAGNQTGNQRQPSRQSDSPSAVLTPVSSEPGAGDETTRVETVPPGSDGDPGVWGGQDTFVVQETHGVDLGAAAPHVGPLRGLFALVHTSRASRLEAKARRSNWVAKASPIGGPPGSGGQLPGQSPFFNLLSGPGGVAAGLALASVLAVMGAAFMLPRDRSRVFPMPAVSWSPLAYVPPIESPG